MEVKFQRVTPFRSLLGALAVGVVIGCHGPAAQADERLAREKNCMACHSVARKLVGPSFEAVAQRYAGQRGAPATIAASMLNGSPGKWGGASMPAQAGLDAAEAERLAGWILSLQPAGAAN
jgi:cytochrome c